MGILHRKDYFGRTIYKIPVKPILFWVILFSLSAWSIFYLACCTNGEPITIKSEAVNLFDNTELFAEEKPEPVVKNEPAPIPKKEFVKYSWRMKYLGDIKKTVSCYSKFDPNDPGHGRYANYKYTELPKNQRVINRSHYTVALNYVMKGYHEERIQLPNGSWTHKYRFHVPQYNKGKRPTDEDIKNNSYLGRTTALLIAFNSSYFSVPRDRLGVRKLKDKYGNIISNDRYSYQNIIDILFTTAGNYPTIKDRQDAWGKRDKQIELWEIEIYAVYSDGTEKKVK